MRFVVLTAAFQRMQVVCVDAVSLCAWFPTFRTWVLGPSKRRESPNDTAYYPRKSESSIYS
jgi:hypothetical protein